MVVRRNILKSGMHVKILSSSLSKTDTHMNIYAQGPDKDRSDPHTTVADYAQETNTKLSFQFSVSY